MQLFGLASRNHFGNDSVFENYLRVPSMGLRIVWPLDYSRPISLARKKTAGLIGSHRLTICNSLFQFLFRFRVPVCIHSAPPRCGRFESHNRARELSLLYSAETCQVYLRISADSYKCLSQLDLAGLDRSRRAPLVGGRKYMKYLISAEPVELMEIRLPETRKPPVAGDGGRGPRALYLGSTGRA